MLMAKYVNYSHLDELLDDMELTAQKSLKDVIYNFFGKNKAPDYAELVQEMFTT